MSANFLSSISLSLWAKEAVFSFFAALGGGVLLWGLWLEFKEEKKPKKEWFSDLGEYRDRNQKRLSGEKWVIVGVVIEIMVGVVFAVMDVRDKYEIGNEVDPTRLPVLNMNAFVVLRVKGNEFPDLTQWDSIPASTNWGSKITTAALCGNGPNSVLQSIPSMISDDFGTGIGFPDSREYFLNFHMESVSAAMRLPMQSASKSFGAANFFSMNVAFLPPQSEIIDGYAFVVINNSLWKLFRIYPQKSTQPAFPSKELAAMLPPIHPVMRVNLSGSKDSVAGVKMQMLEPGQLRNITNGEVFSIEGAGFFKSYFQVVGTNVPSGKFDPNW
jgi:hypothetical protein